MIETKPQMSQEEQARLDKIARDNGFTSYQEFLLSLQLLRDEAGKSAESGEHTPIPVEQQPDFWNEMF